MREVDVVVIGAGAAGVAAARKLAASRLSVLVLEARERAGGRAFSHQVEGMPLDLGCGWLHSADENEWASLAPTLGFAVDKTPPPWSRQGNAMHFPLAEQQDFRATLERFYERLDEAGVAEPDRPADDLVEPGSRWNPLLSAISTWVNGVELPQVSAHDWSRYHDSGTNWRVPRGYGALVSAYAAGLDLAFETPATLVDHAGTRVRIETPRGVVSARAALIVVPTNILAEEVLRFRPALPAKVEAAQALPLGLADKLFLRVADADDLPAETRVFGAIDRTETASFHLRPFGQPLIEAYFGGSLAHALEREGDAAFAAFATEQLVTHFGADFRKRLTPLAVSAWARDPFARGSYSYAKVGHVFARAALGAPVNDRLFFAGEACSLHDFSTAHGAYRTGVAAAEQVASALLPSSLEAETQRTSTV
jgi:monoamine oxidase